ncbi:MAG TPA: c-type cytochrome [Desulfatiglandales bacterium]|nr:c-type cytochrome [Desulfatiglandales bacterium]
MILHPKLNGKLVVITLASILLFFINNNIQAHEWMAPKEAAMEKNPVKMDPDSIQLGQKSFSENCAYCHGDNAEGNKSKSIGHETNPQNLKETIKSHSDGDFFWKIQNGKGEMPSFKDELNANEIWSIINYLKSLSN